MALKSQKQNTPISLGGGWRGTIFTDQLQEMKEQDSTGNYNFCVDIVTGIRISTHRSPQESKTKLNCEIHPLNILTRIVAS